MTDEPKKNGNGIEIKGPGGWGVKATGTHVAFALAAMATVGLPVWAVWEHDRKAEAAHEAHQQQVSEIVYVLTLEPEERKKLDIRMPESLRKKVRPRRQEE